MKGKEFDTKNAPISFIDLEMTGLEGSKHEIVEIGLVKASQPGLEILETWEAKVRPERLGAADLESLKISGYDEERWKNAVSLQEMMRILSEKVRGTILAGWNISTDYAFLDAAVTRTGIPLDFHKHVLDVNSYAAARLGYDWGMSGLNTTAKNLGIALEGHHT
ncbi:3'-5' exonuclease, partial [Candidatus Giovannonibacteria bacterium]|nr:3'-5' exonuclease [Candidatus Giovannonibacteria bacterium]